MVIVKKLSDYNITYCNELVLLQGNNIGCILLKIDIALL